MTVSGKLCCVALPFCCVVVVALPFSASLEGLFMTPCVLFTEDSNNVLNLKNHGNMQGRDDDRVTCVTQ